MRPPAASGGGMTERDKVRMYLSHLLALAAHQSDITSLEISITRNF